MNLCWTIEESARRKLTNKLQYEFGYFEDSETSVRLSKAKHNENKTLTLLSFQEFVKDNVPFRCIT